MKSRLVLIFMIALLFVATGLMSCRQTTVAENENKGTLAPDFVIPDLAGKPVALSDFKGKVVILDMWSIDCDPCKWEFPHFQALYEEYKDKGLVVLGAHVDSPRKLTRVEDFVRAKGITFPVLKAGRNLIALYGGIRGVPTTFVIDREGYITNKIEGPRNKEFFEAVIKDLL